MTNQEVPMEPCRFAVGDIVYKYGSPNPVYKVMSTRFKNEVYSGHTYTTWFMTVVDKKGNSHEVTEQGYKSLAQLVEDHDRKAKKFKVVLDEASNW